MKEPNWIDVDRGKMHEKEYFSEMEREFPEIIEELKSYEDEFYHSKMEVFADYTNQQIEKRSDKELIRCFLFQEERLEKIDSDLENAIHVSYCETLLSENSEQIMTVKKELMPKKLRGYYDDYEKYYIELFKDIADDNE